MPAQNSFDNMTDEEVVFLAQNGSDDALDYILLKFRPQIELKTKSYFLIGADRDDVIQEGLIGLFKAIMDYKTDKDSSFRSFADLCVTRRIISAIKSSTRMKHSPLNGYISLDKSNQSDNPDSTLLNVIPSETTSNPEEIVIQREEMQQMNTKLNETLSAFECTVLALYLEGKSYSEIAAVLKKEPKSVDNALQRIKKKCEKVSPDGID